MKSKIRLLAGTMASLMLVSLLSGCGGDKSGAPVAENKEPVAESKEPTVLKVQWIGDFQQNDSTDPVSGSNKKGVHVLEEEFERLHPDIDLQYVIMGWDDYQKKTQSMLMNGEADVYQAPGISSIAEQGLLEPLTPYVEKDKFDLSIYIDGQVDGWKVVGLEDKEPTIYGLPLIGDTRFIVYDKQLFDEWGVPYLSAEPKLEEVIEAGKRMTGTNPKTGKQNFGIYHKGSDGGDTVMNINEYYGGTWGTGNRAKDMKVTFDTPTMAKAIETLKEINKYAPQGVMVNQGGELFGGAENNVAIHMRSWPAVLNNIQTQGLNDRYGIARLFVNEKVGKGGMFAGSPIVVAANSKSKDAAWEYIKFTATDFFLKYFWENQRNEGLPVLKSAFELENVKNDPNVSAMMNTMKFLWTPRYVYRAGQARKTLTTAVEDVTLNNKPVADVLKQAQKEVDEWISIQ